MLNLILAIKVVATTNATEDKKHPLKGDGKPFGQSHYVDTEIVDIKMNCKDTFHKNQDYEPDGVPEADDKHKSCWCKCFLVEVEIKVNCSYQLNPGKIKKGWFNLDTGDAYTGKKKPGKGHEHEVQLDEESVRIHEKSHCDDITEAIRKRLEKDLNKNAQDYFGECKCSQHEKCKDQINKKVANRIKAIADDEANNVLEKTNNEKYRDSDTEKKAREAQVKYFKDQKKKGSP